MKIKNEFRAAFQLLGLLCLLFWSFTWNIPKDFDFSNPQLKSDAENCLKDAFRNKGINKRSEFAEAFKSGKYLGSSPGSLLPSFNVWKEVELSKQEIKDVRSRIPVAKVPRRKLNYASAKCGAKILASNRESKHRMSILNEKIDEYMLNPCGIKVWFIVELCDTIEVSQVEIANYELFSSVAKDFSVFWSNVYPTQTWHPLGTFQAKNQRTMQTFNIDFQNLGKFIKVVISSHHGREHFCPLSVFRVVGYSMVYEYDTIEEQREQKKIKNDSKMNGAGPAILEEFVDSSKVYSSIKQVTLEVKPASNLKDVAYPTKLCQVIQKYCSRSTIGNACRNQPVCVFLEIVIHKDESMCNICSEESSNDANPTSGSFKANRSETYTKDTVQNTEKYKETRIQNRMSKNLHNSTSTSRKLDEQRINYSGRDLNSSTEYHYSGTKSSQISTANNSIDSSFSNSKNVSQNGGKFSGNTILQLKEKGDIRCDCSKASHTNEPVPPKQNSSSESSLFEQDVADSAALIQKESVLMKINVRIKTLETNLSLINRYLQHLSESYRMQVEEMLNMFDGTIKAITVTSAKAAIVGKQQQFVIDQLDRKVNILTMKIQHLANGQKGIWKQVLELHGFFLILEIIIMSTIFSVFFNKFKRDVLV